MTPLSDREEALLGHLWTFRHLTHPQIQELVLGDFAMRPQSRAVIARRLVRGLCRRGLATSNAAIAGDPDTAPTRRVYFLTKDGLALAGGSGVERRRAQVPRGDLLVAHSLMVADIAIAFRRAASSTVGHVLSTWTSSWELPPAFDRGDVIPDAYLEYEVPGRGIHACLEADRGTEGLRFFEGKIDRYIAFYLRDEWRTHFATWPYVLVVTRTPERASALRRATERVLDARGCSALGGAFRFASIVDIRTHGPLTAVWRTAGETDASGLVRSATVPQPQVETTSPAASDPAVTVHPAATTVEQLLTPPAADVVERGSDTVSSFTRGAAPAIAGDARPVASPAARPRSITRRWRALAWRALLVVAVDALAFALAPALARWWGLQWPRFTALAAATWPFVFSFAQYVTAIAVIVYFLFPQKKRARSSDLFEVVRRLEARSRGDDD